MEKLRRILELWGALSKRGKMLMAAGVVLVVVVLSEILF
jgi:hypothetical protein